MRIEVKGRNVEVTDEHRDRLLRRLDKIGRQVSPLAECDVELLEERNPSIPESEIVEITLRLKGQTLRARSAAGSMIQAVNQATDEMTRQVKRHLDKRRGRRVTPPDKLAPGAAAP
jgi:putative sigma-54 modulation protein